VAHNPIGPELNANIANPMRFIAGLYASQFPHS
jgi:hypothetical protein